jgi:hypothetical protein
MINKENINLSDYPFNYGSECYKDEKAFESKEGICYIPSLAESGIDCYTYDDFLELCHGNEKKARQLFDLCDWTFPETLVDEWSYSTDEEFRNFNV